MVNSELKIIFFDGRFTFFSSVTRRIYNISTPERLPELLLNTEEVVVIL